MSIENKLLTVVFARVTPVPVTASGVEVFDFGQSKMMLNAFDGEGDSIAAA
jgi:hypothetical protein